MTTTTTAAPSTPPPASRPTPPPRNGSSIAATQTARKPRVFATRKKPKIAPRLILNAVEGFGKTTFGAYAPDPLLLMARGETGYDTLLSKARVPAIPAELLNTWAEVLDCMDDLIASPQGRKTVVFDANGGFERLMHEEVCRRDFNNEWGERGFASYQKGYDIAVPEWLKLLGRLDRLKEEHGMTIVMLGHAKVRTFKNPQGADFDRYTTDMHEKTWAPTLKWADAVLFGNFFTVIDKEKQGKGKGVGGVDRVVYSERRDAFDAKNRYGMPSEIWLSNVDPSAVWSTIWNEIEGSGQ